MTKVQKVALRSCHSRLRTSAFLHERVVRLFGLHPTKDHTSVYTEDELRRLVDISGQSGLLELEEQQLIHRVFEFSDAEVRQAMAPRTQVKALTVTATLEDVRAVFSLPAILDFPFAVSDLMRESDYCSEKTWTWGGSLVMNLI